MPYYVLNVFPFRTPNGQNVFNLKDFDAQPMPSLVRDPITSLSGNVELTGKIYMKVNLQFASEEKDVYFLIEYRVRPSHMSYTGNSRDDTTSVTNSASEIPGEFATYDELNATNDTILKNYHTANGQANNVTEPSILTLALAEGLGNGW